MTWLVTLTVAQFSHLQNGTSFKEEKNVQVWDNMYLLQSVCPMNVSFPKFVPSKMSNNLLCIILLVVCQEEGASWLSQWSM